MAEQDTALFLVVTIRPRLGAEAEAEAQLKAMIAKNLTEEGCISMHLTQSADDEPGTWTMIEHFASRAAWDVHMESDHNQQGNAVLEPLLREPSVLRLFHER